MGEKEKKIDEIGALRESRHTASLTEGEHLGAVSELARLVGDFGSTLQLDEILANVSEGIREHVPYDTFAVLLLDDLGQQLVFRFAKGFPDDVVRNWRFGLGQGIVGTAAQTSEVVRVDDVESDERYISATNLQSELAIPLIVKDRMIGVLDVGRRRKGGRFTDGEEQLLKFLARRVANGIENARLFENVRDQAKMLSLINEASRELTSILDREKLLRRVGELVKRLIDYQVFSVMLWCEDDRILEQTFQFPFDERFVQKGGLSLGQGITGTVAAQRQAIRVPNVHLNPLYQRCGHMIEVRSELAVPLVFEDRLIGVIDLESTRYNAFTEQHEQMLVTLASYVAVALENARLYERVKEGERRLGEDLDTARQLQIGLLPKAAPLVQGLRVAFAYEPARQLGGDFYDFMQCAGGLFAIAVGDVAGKGAPAALYGALAMGTVRARVAELPCAPSVTLEEMNRHLLQPEIDNRFVAMAFAIYEPEERTLTVANAGFARPTVIRNGEVTEIQVVGVPLGLLPGSTYDEVTLRLEVGDVVVFASDGITEAQDTRSEQFSQRNMEKLLARAAEMSVQELADELMRASRAFAVGTSEDLHDDRTVVVLKVV
jgi:sigma-B regulation protein RsbU (phosphoserine phosphatase)